jgi:dihydrofolate reductase
MAGNRVIGNGTKIPWHLPDDFKWFKKTTMGGKLLMGRSTFDSIGKPLPGRFTYVLTKDKRKLWQTSATDTHVYTDVAGVYAIPSSKLWVCGGAKVYEQFLPQCSEVYVTHVIGDFEGNVFMPPFEHMFPRQKIIMEHKDFWVVKHSR